MRYLGLTFTESSEEFIDLYLGTSSRFDDESNTTFSAYVDRFVEIIRRHAFKDEVNGDLKDKMLDLTIRISNSLNAKTTQPANKRGETENDEALGKSLDEQIDCFHRLFDSNFLSCQGCSVKHG